MSFFSGTKDKAKLAPRPPESEAGGKWLMDFMKSWGAAGEQIDYPRREVAEMTPFEKQLQDYIQNYVMQGTEGYNLSMEQIKDTLSGEYDPRTSDYWRGFREEAGRTKTGGITDIRQAANLGGMLKSQPRLAAEASYGAEIDSKMLQTLGELWERERDRMETAGQQAAELGRDKFGQVTTATTLAQIPRLIEQEQLDAMYNEVVNELLSPYTLQTNIALSMMGYSPGTWMKAGGESELGKISNAASQISGLLTLLE